MDDRPATPLWAFALGVYRRPGVAEACLDLQDRRGADVNLLLALAWAGAACLRRLGATELAACMAAVEAWHAEVVVPLRRVRRRLKGGPPPAPCAAAQALRARLQALEIEAERIEIERLETMLDLAAAPGSEPERRQLAADNLAAYLAGLAGAEPARDQAALTALGRAAVAEASRPA